MSAATPTPRGRVIATALVFALIMPAIGIIVAVAAVAIVFGFGPQSIFSSGETITVFAALGYAVGVIPAAGVGAAVGWRDRERGASRGWAAGAGLVGGLVFAVALLIFAPDRSLAFFVADIAAVAIAVVGALVAWKVTRPMRRAGLGVES